MNSKTAFYIAVQPEDDQVLLSRQLSRWLKNGVIRSVRRHEQWVTIITTEMEDLKKLHDIIAWLRQNKMRIVSIWQRD